MCHSAAGVRCLQEVGSGAGAFAGDFGDIGKVPQRFGVFFVLRRHGAALAFHAVQQREAASPAAFETVLFAEVF